MSRRGATLGVSLGLAAVLGLAGTQLPVPYVGLGPGPVYNTLGASGTTQLIQLPSDRDHPASGELDLTTVNVFPRLTLGGALLKWFDKSYAVVPHDVIYPPGQSPKQSAEETAREMRESQQHAVNAALCEAGLPVRANVVVESVQPGGGAAVAGIRAKDLIRALDGATVDSTCTLRRLMRAHRAGDTVRIVVARGGKRSAVEVRTTAAPDDGHALLGVSLTETGRRPPFPVRIALNDVGGPSAGLMFALGVYDRLTPGDLTGGKVVAGTGTIDDEGRVGPIGGIQQKLVGAHIHGARCFLTPDGNYDDARRALPKGMTLLRVKTLRDAIAAVERIAGGEQAGC